MTWSRPIRALARAALPRRPLDSRFPVCCVWLLAILAPALPASGDDGAAAILADRGRLIVSEDFSKPFPLHTGKTPSDPTLAGWSVVIPQWEFVPGGLKGTHPTGQAHGSSFAYGFHFQNVVFQADFQMNGCQRVIFPINAATDPMLHLARFIFDQNGGLLVKSSGKSGGKVDSVKIGKFSTVPLPGQWYTLRFEIRGDRITANFAGQTITATAAQLGSSPDKSSIGFGVWYGTAMLRNVRIWEAQSSPAVVPDAVVAADGSAQYRTIESAIKAVPRPSRYRPGEKRWTILIKPGTYREVINLERERSSLNLVGEDAEKTVITFNLNQDVKYSNGEGTSPYRTATVFIDADDFTAENLTFENPSGEKYGGDAFAVQTEGDRQVFRHCRFVGWSDTLLLVRGRQYFADCTIVGKGDFIFGGATAFFDRCHIVCLGRRGQLSAPSTPAAQPYGLVFSHCTISGSDPANRTYLSRPWREYGEAIFLHTEMSGVVMPAGWLPWLASTKEDLHHARFGEFGSTGPGAPQPGQRAPWAKALTAREAEDYTVDKVLAGTDGWNPTQP